MTTRSHKGTKKMFLNRSWKKKEGRDVGGKGMVGFASEGDAAPKRQRHLRIQITKQVYFARDYERQSAFRGEGEVKRETAREDI